MTSIVAIASVAWPGGLAAGFDSEKLRCDYKPSLSLQPTGIQARFGHDLPYIVPTCKIDFF
jgi:hypothetical protein